MSNRRQILTNELRGLRLALYDEALGAGPRGLTAPELRTATYEEAQRMGLRPEAHAEAIRWLVDHHLLHEYQAGRYRARSLDEAAADETAQPSPSPTAQLRTPVIEPKTRKGGQISFL